MKKLSRIDIDLMSKELSVMLKEEQSSTVGGVFTTSSESFKGGSDCALQSLSHLSGRSVPEMTTAYSDLYVDTYLGTPNDSNGGRPYTETELRAKVDSDLGPRGAGVNSIYAQMLFDTYISSDSTTMYARDEGSEEYIMGALKGNGSGLFASVQIKKVITGDGREIEYDSGTMNHSVVLVDYDSGTQKFTYYDPQAGASGTFDWEDLEYVKGRN